MLDELERLEQAATPGPWEAFTFAPEPYRVVVLMEPEDDESGPSYIVLASYGDSPANLRCIAAARNALPALLRVAREAAELSEALSDEFEDAADWKDAKAPLQTMGRRVAAALAALDKEA